jgi:beta-lactamase class C
MWTRRSACAAVARAFVFALLFVGCSGLQASAQTDAELQNLVAQRLQQWVDGGTGAAVVIRMQGRTSFINLGTADRESGRQVSSDDIFNLASVGKLFAATLLAQAVDRGELRLDDPVANYVTELQKGGDIRRVTLGQLASHTSGLTRAPGETEPWHRGKYSLPDFIRYLNAWQAGPGHEPGQQDIYSNSGLVLLRLALERRFNMPFAALMEQRILMPLGMNATALPLPATLRRRAVQAMARPGGRSARRARSRACSTGRAPARSIRRLATWRRSSSPISANCPISVRWSRR